MKGLVGAGFRESDEESGKRNSRVAKLLKIIGVVALIMLAGALAVYFVTEARLNEVYAVEAAAVNVPEDREAIRRGYHLVHTVAGCVECHGNGLSGELLMNDPFMGRLAPANLTSGEGGIADKYETEDWVRAIRHGVDPEGKPLIAVSSLQLAHLSDEDLGAIIAYIQQIPPVDNELPETRIGPLGRLFLLISPELLPASLLDHEAEHLAAIEPEVSAAYGAYLAATACSDCHGDDMAGTGGAAGAGLNLTPGGELGDWSEADFLNTIRTGVTPEGCELEGELMPWERIRDMSDEELRAIWLYLQSLPPVTQGEGCEPD